jgi:hypothetical protein
MGPRIVIPVVVLLVVVPLALMWAKRYLKDGEPGRDADAVVVASGSRLTSNALRELPAPPWRVVYEIAPERLGGVEHVLLGPPGVFAIRTSMEPLPAPPAEHDAHAVAQAAILRGRLDDALGRCAMSSDRLLQVHWGANPTGPPAVDELPGVTAVDGRALAAWLGTLPTSLSAAQVDLAWQTVTTAIGRPDPLA